VNATLARVEASLGLPGVIVNNAGVGGPFHRVDLSAHLANDLPTF
jgi:3-oxoacyl-[acyl-carrier protein] reductase